MVVRFKVPYFENHLTYTGKVIGVDGNYSIVEYKNNNELFVSTNILTENLIEIKC